MKPVFFVLLTAAGAWSGGMRYDPISVVAMSSMDECILLVKEIIKITDIDYDPFAARAQCIMIQDLAPSITPPMPQK